MANFVYRALTAEGSMTEGVTQAPDEKNAVERLRDMGLIPVSLDVPKQGSRRRMSIRSPKGQLLPFTTELVALLKAGLPLERGLTMLAEASDNEEMKRTIQDLVKSLREGHAFSDSLQQHPKIFPRFYANMVRAGEAGGVLDLILAKMKEFLESSKELRDSIVSAMIYPVILIGTGGVCIGVLLTFVLPRFSVIFSDLGKSLPVSTQMLLTFSATLRAYWWVILSVTGLSFAAGVSYVRSARGRYTWDALKLKVLGGVIRKLETARFCRTLGTLLGGGVPLIEAISNAKAVLGNQVIAEAISGVSGAVREGKGIGMTLAGTNTFPTLAISMIRVGEETGQLDTMLLEIATLYESSLRESVKRLVSLLEPVLIVGMGLIVGFIVVSMLSAIFSITDLPV